MTAGWQGDDGVVKCIQEVVSICIHVHSDIIHCDIKPSNVLVETNGQCKLADFGTAKMMANPMEGSTGLLQGSRSVETNTSSIL